MSGNTSAKIEMASIKEAQKYIKAIIHNRRPRIAVVLGSGLGGLGKKLKNKVIISGSGKTYLSQRLIKRIQAVYIDKDKIDDAFTTSRIGHTYEKFKPYVHKIMYAIASINLKLGNSVILDSPFTRRYMGNPDWIKFINNFAKKHKAIIKVLWCEAPNHIRKRRIIKRNHERDRERHKEMDEFIGRARRFDIPFEHKYIETNKADWKNILNFLKR